MKPQLKNVILELATEASLVPIFPFSVDNLEGYILIGRACTDEQNAKVCIVFARCQSVLWSCPLVNQIRIKNVEFVTLHHFGRRVVHVIMSLIVLVPLKASMDSVEVSRFPRPILVGPFVRLLQC